MKRYQKIINFLLLLVFIFSFSVVWARPSFLEMRNQDREEYQRLMNEGKRGFKKFMESKEDFKTAKERYRQMKTERAAELLKERGRQFLLNMIEARFKHLEALKKRIQVAKKITNQDKEALLSQIDEQVVWLSSKKQEVQNAQTEEELTSLAKEIRDYIKNTRVLMKKIIGGILAGKVAWVVEKSEETSKTISQKIDSLKDKGHNTSSLEVNLAEFNSKIEAAKKELEKARNSFSQISSGDEANKLFQEGMKYLKNAHRYLQEARQILVKIKNEIRKAEGEEETEEESETIPTQ